MCRLKGTPRVDWKGLYISSLHKRVARRLIFGRGRGECNLRRNIRQVFPGRCVRRAETPRQRRVAATMATMMAMGNSLDSQPTDPFPSVAFRPCERADGRACHTRTAWLAWRMCSPLVFSESEEIYPARRRKFLGSSRSRATLSLPPLSLCACGTSPLARSFAAETLA